MTGEFNKFAKHFIVNRKIPYADRASMRGFLISAYRRLLSRFD
jgi:hypothetical protein